MDIAALRVFRTVAEERGFSRAAVRLFRTQSAVSQAVRRLEEELRADLFDRTTHVVRLTEAGKTLLAYAERVLAVTDEAERAVREVVSLPLHPLLSDEDADRVIEAVRASVR